MRCVRGDAIAGIVRCERPGQEHYESTQADPLGQGCGSVKAGDESVLRMLGVSFISEIVALPL